MQYISKPYRPLCTSIYFVQMNPTATQNFKPLTAALSAPYKHCNIYHSLTVEYVPQFMSLHMHSTATHNIKLLTAAHSAQYQPSNIYQCLAVQYVPQFTPYS
jgi:hypothetical protein